MKSFEKSRRRTRTAPLKITLTEAEILADLHYPVDLARMQRTVKAAPIRR